MNEAGVLRGANKKLAVIGDEDTVTGLLLAGIGHKSAEKGSNFLIVDSKTSLQKIEDAFRSFTTRKDISIVLIVQTIANDIRYLLDDYEQVVPAILEIPRKDHPYDPEKDSVMLRLKKMNGG